MDDGHSPAAVLDRVIERELRDAAASGARIDAGADGHRMRVVADRNVVLEADVEALEVLPDQDEIDVVVAPAGHDRADRAQVGVKLELLAQAHVHRSVPAAHRRGERALQRHPGAADAVQCGLRQRISAFLDRRHPALLRFPREGHPQRVEDLHGRADDLRTDPVTGDEGGRDLVLAVLDDHSLDFPAASNPIR
jgi:hypothetical protein